MAQGDVAYVFWEVFYFCRYHLLSDVVWVGGVKERAASAASFVAFAVGGVVATSSVGPGISKGPYDGLFEMLNNFGADEPRVDPV